MFTKKIQKKNYNKIFVKKLLKKKEKAIRKYTRKKIS